MDLVLDLLTTVTPASAKAAADLLCPELLAASSAPQKHKLKTRISALLKSSGTARAVGAVLARRALVDWSIVKSHGATWAPILLHILDLPDRVCWAPAVKTLTFLYTQVHGKTDLSRETGGSKIGEFMKRLVKVLAESDASLFYAVTRMLQLYPTQCRPYLNKLAPLLDVPGGERALASLCLAEKTGAEFWQQRVAELLTRLDSDTAEDGSSDVVGGRDLAKLREYVLVAGDIRAKIPAARLVRVLNKHLKSYKPLPTIRTLEFMLATRTPLETLYIQSFDQIVYNLVDCVELGKRVAIDVAEFMAWELRSVGWVSESYSHVLTRLSKKLLAVSAKQHECVGVEGLADYVQNPASFRNARLARSDAAALASYFSAVVLCVPTTPQSVRSQIDLYLLANGSADDVAKATLYAGRFSILPLAIHERLPDLRGLESLIHPRFPPLNISQHGLQIAADAGQENSAGVEGTQNTFSTIDVAEQPEPEPTSYVAGDDEDSTAKRDDETGQEEKPLPPIPESTKPVYRGIRESSDAPPEKRQRLSEPEAKPESGLETGLGSETRAEAVRATEATNEPATRVAEQVMQISTIIYNELPPPPETADTDSDEELVIPTLTMDSD